jgi:hypothetical protein
MIQTVQALATVTVAVFAVIIAFMQWWTARQKLVLDLFERRFQVFLDARRIASEAIQLGKAQQPGAINEVIARSRFLFDDDVNDVLSRLHGLMGELEMGNLRAATEVNKILDELLPLFSEYLTMDQRPPRLPWVYARHRRDKI